MNVDQTKIYNKTVNPRLLQQEQEKNRKGKKNRNKNNPENKKPPQPVEQMTIEQEKVLAYVEGMFQNHKKQTIINVMKRVGKDIQAITNQMLQIPQDKETSTTNGKHQTKNYHNKNLQLECFELMNNLTEEIQIDEFQFQELFEEVSEIIKNNAEINKVLGSEMISQCQESKHQFNKIRQAYLDELKIDDVDDEYLKSKYDTLLIEIQQFLLNQAKIAPQYKESNVYKTYADDFPTLDAQPGQSVANKIHWDTVKDKIEKEKNFGKTSYFDQSNKKLPIWDQSNSLHELNGGNQIEKKDIQILLREYQMMNLTDLKIIYSHIGDLGYCRKFLNEYYSQQKSLKRQVHQKINKGFNQSPIRKKSIENISRLQLDKNQINGELQKMNLRQLREFITHQMKLRAIFMQASSKTKNSNSKKKLVGMANENNTILMEYLIASRVKHLEQVFSLDGNVLDLHGYFAIEAEELVREYIRAIKVEYKKGNNKITSKTKQGRLFAEVNVITGKGNNSAHQKSVLKPLIKKVLSMENVDFDEHQGGFTVKVFLN